MNKIKEGDLKLIKEQQVNLKKLVSNIGILESQKHGLLHEVAVVNKDIEEFKDVLENKDSDIEYTSTSYQKLPDQETTREIEEMRKKRKMGRLKDIKT